MEPPIFKIQMGDLHNPAWGTPAEGYAYCPTSVARGHVIHLDLWTAGGRKFGAVQGHRPRDAAVVGECDRASEVLEVSLSRESEKLVGVQAHCPLHVAH